ncbi:hypothetical protein [Streptomyces sp. NPDC059262]|uniref:hypothetical protein n=1 Tax=Streptomyces sp. NPDC059262 TaxID=3346797 RepID=UPI0036B55C99
MTVLSADPSELATPPRGEQDLGAKYPLRYGCTELPLERGGRYYAAPLDWKPRTDPLSSRVVKKS